MECGGGHAACAALLLSAGADAAKASDANGRTALDWAVDSQAELCGRAECARLVLAAGLPAERAPTAIAGFDARGFIFGPPLALALGVLSPDMRGAMARAAPARPCISQ